ncbi:MAG: Na+/H+ antiporter NhaC family protein [Corynebacterium sp.]|nr:Na+/H+ antiporter NhaC family protein [Corynebacterium sp.]
MNAVLIAVVLMLLLTMVLRVHVVLALFFSALAGGLLAGLGLDATMVAFQDGLSGGAKIALSYALLGAFAMAVSSAGLPELLSQRILRLIGKPDDDTELTTDTLRRSTAVIKWLMLAGILAMSIMSQNLIPVHIAFIPLLIPPLLGVMNRLRLDRRLVACVLTFGLVTTYMWIPIGFGSIFLNDILLGNIENAGLDTSEIQIFRVMAIPALGMISGLLIAVFISYRKPRDYQEVPLVQGQDAQVGPSRYKVAVSLIAIVATFAVQLVMQVRDMEADALLVGALVGLAIFLGTGVVNWRQADDVFTQGMKMMAVIGFIMITAQGFASVMQATGDLDGLVTGAANIVGSNKGVAAMAMLLVGLLVTMGIGSSFSTLPIITTIYVPLCLTLGFSPAATVAIIGAAGALGDAGSPASDSTLGSTAGLNVDGQHDHIRDTVIPTFIHYNLPLLISGWIAAMVL